MTADPSPVHQSSAHQAVERVWRAEAPRVVARLTRLVRDVGLAEDLAGDALVAALEQWPAEGVPANPGAWLTTAASRRALDALRRDRMRERTHPELARALERAQEATSPDAAAAVQAMDDPAGDDLLRLLFVTCHPALAPEARVALTLRLLGGLATPEIARAFLTSEGTVAQRIVRAKRTLAAARATVDVYAAPRGEALRERLPAVLQVVYLIYNEGYAASAGDDWTRPDLAGEALRLGRLLAAVARDAAEAHGLLALMALHASRAGARVDAAGEAVPLTDQDRARWDRALVAEGLAALAQAESVARAAGEPLGPYALQAAIAACHARARTAAETAWGRIVALYDALAEAAPSPVVALNRAVAVSMARGPGAALPLVDALAGEPALAGYHWLPSVRADLLARLGRDAEAGAEWARAAALTQNARERALLLARATAASAGAGPAPR